MIPTAVGGTLLALQTSPVITGPKKKKETTFHVPGISHHQPIPAKVSVLWVF